MFLTTRYDIFFDSSGVPFSKPLYTLSYMFVTAGASGVLLTIIYFFVSSFHGWLSVFVTFHVSFKLIIHIQGNSTMQVDMRCIRKPTLLFQWMGMNALIVYALAACDIFPAAVQGFYWRSPQNNMVIHLKTLQLFSRLLLLYSTRASEIISANNFWDQSVFALGFSNLCWSHFLPYGLVFSSTNTCHVTP